MTIPIIERPLYPELLLQTSPWSTPFTWTNHLADTVGTISYSIGGRIGTPGSSETDVGTLNVTLKNSATVPAVGALVRLLIADTLDEVFTGYVQDVSQTIVFDRSESYTDPITLTTLYCVDWVGYISQFQSIGAGGAHPTTGVDETDSSYAWNYRVAALNKIIDSSYATKMIRAASGVVGFGYNLGDNDLDGTLAQQIDLLATSAGLRWRGEAFLPTNKTTGRTSLITVYDRDGYIPSGLTFTDVVGTTGQLHYTEIDFENSTMNIANSIVASNRTRFHVPDVEVTKIGGFNEENFVVVNNTNVIGIGVDSVQQKSDSTSITTYGQRQTEIFTNVALPIYATGNVNLIANPSMEYSDEGYFHGGTVWGRVRRRKPSEDANPFTAYTGEWAMRSRITTAAANTRIDYSGGESDGIPAVAGTTYYFKARAARGTVSRTDVQARVTVAWYDDSETQIGTGVSGSYVALTTANTWYQMTTGAIVAPANTVRAVVHVFFTRSGGGNHSVGDKLWADAYQLSKANIDYFDGDTAWTSTGGYIWTGGVGASPSYKVSNVIDNVAADTLTTYSTTSNRATRIRWNAQEDLTVLNVDELFVGNTIDVTYNSSTSTYVIIGMDATIDAERYMIDIYLAKV